ncbi:hypothetical protein ACHAPJ_009225 [Fusarium lateritium]
MAQSGPLPPVEVNNDTQLVFVGIDFGTTFSGIAFKVFGSDGRARFPKLNEYSSELNGFTDVKVPTKLPAEKYSTDERYKDTWLEWFKLSLLHRDDMPHDVLDLPKFTKTSADRESLGLSTVTVTADYLKKIWKDFYDGLLQVVSNPLIQITMTVPAVWPKYAREKMLEAIEKAEILGPNVQLAPKFLSEPEATAIALLPEGCNVSNPESSTLKKDDVVIICDCGGGTVDSIAYEVCSLQPFLVKEVIPGECILSGGALLDDAFMDLLEAKARAICPGPTFKALGRLSGVEEFARNHWEHDMKMYHIDNAKEKSYPLPLTWAGSNVRRGRVGTAPKISFSSDELSSVFDPIVGKIVKLVTSQMEQVMAATNKKTSHVVVAGGFGRNLYLQKKVEQTVSEISPSTVVHSYSDTKGWTSVARGAVLHALQTHHQSLEQSVHVSSRIARASYGVYSGLGQSVTWLINKGDSLSAVNPNRRPLPMQALSTKLTPTGQMFTFHVCRRMVPNGQEQLMCRINWTAAKPKVGSEIEQGGLEIDFNWDGSEMGFSVVYGGIRQGHVSVEYSCDI